MHSPGLRCIPKGWWKGAWAPWAGESSCVSLTSLHCQPLQLCSQVGMHACEDANSPKVQNSFVHSFVHSLISQVCVSPCHMSGYMASPSPTLVLSTTNTLHVSLPGGGWWAPLLWRDHAYWCFHFGFCHQLKLFHGRLYLS